MRRQQKKQTIGSCDIYFDTNSIVVAEERLSMWGDDMSNYVMFQNWFERRKKPFKNFKRWLKSQNNDLKLIDILCAATRYNVEVTTVDIDTVPKQFKPVNLAERK